MSNIKYFGLYVEKLTNFEYYCGFHFDKYFSFKAHATSFSVRAIILVIICVIYKYILVRYGLPSYVLFHFVFSLY